MSGNSEDRGVGPTDAGGRGGAGHRVQWDRVQYGTMTLFCGQMEGTVPHSVNVFGALRSS